ncbi:MAG: S8 family serine peptidase [Pseudomonadota bacterium]
MQGRAIIALWLLLSTAIASHATELQRSAGTFRFQSPATNLMSRVVVDAVASGHVDRALLDLQSLGLQSHSVFNRIISGTLPLAQLPLARTLASINQIQVNRTITASGQFTSEGDAALRADTARHTFSVDGSGVKVAVISDSYNCLGGEENDRSDGELPQQLIVVREAALCEGLVDEGRAIMHLVHDIAPGAELLFLSGTNGYASLANGILKLAADYDVNIIVDDAKSLSAPFFQKGAIVRAVEQVVQQGVVYVTAAGNSARLSYQSEYRNSYNPVLNLHAHDFDAGAGTDILQRIELPEDRSISLIFQWDSPAFSVSGQQGAVTDLDIHLLDAASGRIVAEAASGNLRKDPIEVLEFYNPAGSGSTIYELLISKAAGPDPTLIKYILFNRFEGELAEHHSQSGTVFGHANSQLAITVGAGNYLETPAYGHNSPLLEYFSSAGGDTPWLFDGNGNRFTSIQTPAKPDLIAPDNINTPFPLGEDTDGDGNPNFRGTSAAAPHVAGVAALMLQLNDRLHPHAVKSILQQTAVDVRYRNDSARTFVGNSYDRDSGYGLVDAQVALSLAEDFDPASVLDDLAETENIVVHETITGSGTMDWRLILLLVCAAPLCRGRFFWQTRRPY